VCLRPAFLIHFTVWCLVLPCFISVQQLSCIRPSLCYFLSLLDCLPSRLDFPFPFPSLPLQLSFIFLPSVLQLSSFRSSRPQIGEPPLVIFTRGRHHVINTSILSSSNTIPPYRRRLSHLVAVDIKPLITRPSLSFILTTNRSLDSFSSNFTGKDAISLTLLTSQLI
jgi:hypothetical protein